MVRIAVYLFIKDFSEKINNLSNNNSIEVTYKFEFRPDNDNVKISFRLRLHNQSKKYDKSQCDCINEVFTLNNKKITDCWEWKDIWSLSNSCGVNDQDINAFVENVIKELSNKEIDFKKNLDQYK